MTWIVLIILFILMYLITLLRRSFLPTLINIVIALLYYFETYDLASTISLILVWLTQVFIMIRGE